MGTAVASGTNRAVDAANRAISSPLLEDNSIQGAQGILINMTGSSSLSLHEVHEASSIIQKAAHENANIIFGAVMDEAMKEAVKITVIAAGFRDVGRKQQTSVLLPKTWKAAREPEPEPQQVTSRSQSRRQSPTAPVHEIIQPSTPTTSTCQHSCAARPKKPSSRGTAPYLKLGSSRSGGGPEFFSGASKLVTISQVGEDTYILAKAEFQSKSAGASQFDRTAEESMNLRNAVALITGGSAGIGRAIAQSLAASGARVAITGRDKGRLSEAARALGAFPIHADVAKEDDVQRTYRELLAQFGDLDILVNNAGFGVFKSLVDSDRASFDAVFATNVTGAMLMAREAAKHFIARQRGNIVNISSTAGLRGAANGTAYYASKFALRGMTECWRAELRRHNIRVFLVNPSEVLTSFAASAGLAQKENETKLRSEEIAYIVKAALEMDDRGFTPELSVFATNPKD